jgi:hypothetical protein
MKPVRKPLALLMLLTAAGAAAAADPPPPRRLIVDVRDTPPQRAAAIRYGADGSYSVSSGGGDRDDRAHSAVNADDSAVDNSTTVSTGNAVRRVHITQGERVRVDLPSVQSLQFHLPVPGVAAGRTAAGAAGPNGTASAAAATPAVSGVVTFAAVSAFTARFSLAGSTVRVELTPLQSGTVSAPYAAAGAPAATVTVQGRVGQWIALGDTELSNSGATLNATPDPIQPASVWVRVQPEPADVPE